MSKATIRDIMYLFKEVKTFVIFSDNGNCGSFKMTWDECWKYCRDRNWLNSIPNSCSIFLEELHIWL